MTPELASDWLREAMVLGLTVAAPVLLVLLVAALIVGLLQAMTQLQDQTISAVPKLIAAAIALVVAGPWMIKLLMAFAQQSWGG